VKVIEREINGYSETSPDGSAFEREIDERVNNLYGLKKDEERACKRRKQQWVT